MGSFFCCLSLGVALNQPADAMQFANGSYTGNGTDNRPITGVGFRPDAVIIKAGNANHGVMRTASMTGDATKLLASGTALVADHIQSLRC